MHRDFATAIEYSLTQLGQAKLTLLRLYCCVSTDLVNAHQLHWGKTIQQGVVCQLLPRAGSSQTRLVMYKQTLTLRVSTSNQLIKPLFFLIGLCVCLPLTAVTVSAVCAIILNFKIRSGVGM